MPDARAVRSAPAPISIPHDFSLTSYTATLRGYLDAGYAVTGFDDYLDDPQPRHLILRHDIDNDLELAVRMARADAEAGCRATFFLRLHSRGYSLLSLPSMRMIRQIESLGHGVELHLEGGFGDWLGGTDSDWAERQRTIFEEIVGRPMTGFSMHEPARMGGYAFADELRERWRATVRYHAYEDRFMMPQMKYLSDSSGTWREGHFAGWIGREPRMQVLTHPFWWYERIPAENY